MQEKDLFAALSYVDDAYVEEAEMYAAARKMIPLHTVRWTAALAACVCLLLGWAVAVQLAPFGGFGSFLAKDAAAPENATEGCVVESTTDAGVAEEEKAEEAEIEESNAEETVMSTEAPENTAGADREGASGEMQPAEYVILADAFPSLKSEEKTLYADPLNGTLLLDEELQKTHEQCALVNMTGPPRFLVSFDLYRDGEKLETNSKAYLTEIARLEELSYEFRRLVVTKRDKSVSVQPCWLLTGAQLDAFAASEEYGYYLYFPKNEDGTPLDWNNQVELCGLPTAEDALVTKD